MVHRTPCLLTNQPGASPALSPFSTERRRVWITLLPTPLPFRLVSLSSPLIHERHQPCDPCRGRRPEVNGRNGSAQQRVGVDGLAAHPDEERPGILHPDA